MNHNLLFLYDHDLAKYLRYTKGIEFITKARHLHTHKIFYIFERTQEVSDGIDEFKKK